jgi:hypothetical protein
MMNSILLTISIMQMRAQLFFDDSMSFENVIKSWESRKDMDNENYPPFKDEARHDQIQ